mmetsp:Transcript_1576/g.2156  ORF Transcript_1576/g.2156 Transcript_1576/m.2156 type:complete len:231 (+) Transcript_1576:78-770(+)
MYKIAPALIVMPVRPKNPHVLRTSPSLLDGLNRLTASRRRTHTLARSLYALESLVSGDKKFGNSRDSPDEDRRRQQVRSFATNVPPRQDKKEAVGNQSKVDVIFEKIKWLDMVELHLLTSLIQEKLGLQGPGAHINLGGGAGGGGADDNAQEAKEEVKEKTTFDIKLVGFDAKAKIKVIKEVRNIAELGLKEAKELVENAPKVFLKEIKKDQAEEIKEKLEAVGAEVEIS